MANDPVKVINNLSLSLKLKDITNLGKQKMGLYAESLAEDIKKRTRLGYGTKTNNGPKGKFIELAPSTKKQRARHKQSGDLSSFSTPNKSNLSDTGEMVDSIKGRGKSDYQGEVYLEGDRNNEIAEYHEEGTSKMPMRPFLHADSSMVKRLTDFIYRDIIGKLNRTIKKIVE